MIVRVCDVCACASACCLCLSARMLVLPDGILMHDGFKLRALLNTTPFLVIFNEEKLGGLYN